jgi:hypothetical protein
MAVVDSTLANMVEANNAVTAAVADKKQSNKDLGKTKLCVYYLEGRCGYGTSCTYAHSLLEVKSVPDLTKTQLCVNFAEGMCNDEHCTYAHGEAELRDPPNFKKKLCKWYSKGKCRNGVNCGFAHDIKDLRMEAPPGFESLEVKVSQPLKPKKSQKIDAPPGLTKMDADNDCDVSTDVPSSPSQDESDSSTAGVASIPEEHLFRFAAARGSAPLQQQVALMSSAIGGLQAKLGQLEDMMLQTQVLQMQQTIQELSQQCWALEGQMCLEQPEPTPLLLESGFECKSRLNAKAAPFKPGM